MGEPDDSLNKFNKPLEIATSSSPEALQLVSKAFKSHFSPTRAVSISYYERAIDLDPNFALAYASVGAQYFNGGKTDQAVAAEKRAYELRDRLTGQLRFLAETLYYSIGLGDLERAVPVYQEWIRTFPLDGVAHFNFAGCLIYLGRYDEAATESREALRLMPLLVGVGSYYNLIRSTTFSGRLEEAKRLYAEARSRKIDSPDLRRALFIVAFLQHDDRAAEALLLQAKQQPEFGALYYLEANAQAYKGRFSQNPAWLRNAVELSEKSGNAGFADEMKVIAFIAECEVGKREDGARLVKEMSVGKGSRQRINLALALARNGETGQALKLAEEVDREAPFNTLIQKYALPTIRAAVKLRQNQAESAIEILRPAEQYDFAFLNSFDFMYPTYIRGLAYLQLGRGREAAEQFQDMIDHPAVVRINVIGALAHLQFGRAQTLIGNRAAARKAYQDFLTIWKDADPDIPIYKQAKAEYAKL
jgi:eukaryotic-like serine/threonine-protein kinase